MRTPSCRIPAAFLSPALPLPSALHPSPRLLSSRPASRPLSSRSSIHLPHPPRHTFAATMSTSAPDPYHARMVHKLQSALSPTTLVLTDESAQHAGHAGNPGGGETHFNLEIASEAFRGLKQLECHRLVYKVLKDEMEEKVHALSIKTSTPP